MVDLSGVYVGHAGFEAGERSRRCASQRTKESILPLHPSDYKKRRDFSGQVFLTGPKDLVRRKGPMVAVDEKKRSYLTTHFEAQTYTPSLSMPTNLSTCLLIDMRLSDRRRLGLYTYSSKNLQTSLSPVVQTDMYVMDSTTKGYMRLRRRHVGTELEVRG